MRTALFSPKIVFSSAAAVAGVTTMFVACSDSYRPPHANGGAGGASGGAAHGGGGSSGVTFDARPCPATCSNDLKSIVDCNGVALSTCTVDQGCANAVCIDNPCMAAEVSKSSYGCDYWALKTAQRTNAAGACFVAFIANTWGKPVHLQVERNGSTLPPIEMYTRIPQGQGKAITYGAYDPVMGLPVDEVAILFLSRSSLGATVIDCPVPAAVNGFAGETGVAGTGIGNGFHITSDYPVVAYQMTPYGGGGVAFTSATLLLPTSAWDNNYVAINGYPSADQTIYPGGFPSLDIIAYKDNTLVTILPKADIVAGPGVMGATAGMPAMYTLNTGQFLQISQPNELTGSALGASEAIGVFGGHTGMQVPLGNTDIDSAQQQIPPVKALGSEYVAVRYRGRGGQDEAVPWRLVGAVDGTVLTWVPKPPMGAKTTISSGETVEFTTPGPFVVKSQGADHPFYLGGYMTGGGGPSDGGPGGFGGEGDPDWVNVVPPPQYLNHYVLFTDPTYSETNLVLVRTPSKLDPTHFEDVTLNCAGASMPQKVTGWQPIGAYQYTRIDLVTGNFMGVNGCANGRQELTSTLPFGVTVWGWGTSAEQTQLVSYAYPAGAGFQPINTVVVKTTP
jgi:hypothetical protein